MPSRLEPTSSTASGQSISRHRWRTGLGRVLGVVLWLWVKTWRVRVLGGPALEGECPIVICFWHGTQMALLGWPRRRQTAAMVSWSKDGALQAGILGMLGMQVVRGSTSRGASSGLRRVVRALRNGKDAAFAVDGPRGPLGFVHCGAATAAELASAELVPMAAVAWPTLVLSRTWDRYRLVLPFARVCVAFGPRLDPEQAREEPSVVARAIDEAACRAEGALELWRDVSTCAPPAFLGRQRR